MDICTTQIDTLRQSQLTMITNNNTGILVQHRYTETITELYELATLRLIKKKTLINILNFWQTKVGSD